MKFYWVFLFFKYIHNCWSLVGEEVIKIWQLLYFILNPLQLLDFIFRTFQIVNIF